jgi:DNA-binding MarR family transcriptional regulator
LGKVPAVRNGVAGVGAGGTVEAEDGSLLADPTLHALYEFTELVAANVRSARQRERVFRAARVPLTSAGLNVLRIVQRHAPIAVTELARRLGVDQSTASRQLRPLEEQRLVTRAGDEADRRVAWLSLTPRGRRVLDRTIEAWLADYDVALADWSAADRAALGELIDRLRNDLSTTNPNSNTDPHGSRQ